jgi:hypothetical protein
MKENKNIFPKTFELLGNALKVNETGGSTKQSYMTVRLANFTFLPLRRVRRQINADWCPQQGSSPKNEQHKKWRSPGSLSPLPSPPEEGEWQGRWFWTPTMAGDCKTIMRRV